LLDKDAVVPYGLIYLSRTTYHFEQETPNDLDRFQLKGLAQQPSSTVTRIDFI